MGGKLLGAVAYAWPYGKEPIAGITPFAQMRSFVESYERHDLDKQAKARRIGLRKPLTIDGLKFETVTVSQGFEEPKPNAEDGLWMVPLRTPLAATGFTSHSLKLLRTRCRSAGLVPMLGGATTGKVAEKEKDVQLQPGGPLAVALVEGDFDLSGIGTVTHIEGNRVYGWGHPFFGSGRCELPLMTGYIHTIYPRQSISFKMGSPLRTVGIINADVSTCIAGWLNRKPDMLPMRMTVIRDHGLDSRTFNVRVVRQRSLISSLVYSCLTNSVDTEGELPEEMTAELKVRIEVEGHEPIIIHDTFSGSSISGGRAPSSLYSQIGSVVNLLTFNSYKPVRIKRIDCETKITPGRRSADIDSVELDSETYSPGETLKATVFVRPYRGLLQRIPVKFKLPSDLPEGDYSVIFCDDLANARFTFRDNPVLNCPQNVKQIFQALKVQTSVKRNSLVLRIPTSAVGVALEGKALPNLPSSMVQIMGTSRRTGAQSISGALVSRQITNWVLRGSETMRFTVAKHKRLVERE
jgi:hypothetical protein